MNNKPETTTHKPSMNLRFVERIDGERTIRVLQQMMVPEDWSKHDEYWQDVRCYKESDLNQ